MTYIILFITKREFMSKTNLKLLIESIVNEEKTKYLLESEILIFDPDAKKIFEEMKELSTLSNETDVEKIIDEIKKNIHNFPELKPKKAQELEKVKKQEDKPKSRLEKLLSFLNPDKEETLSGEEQNISHEWEKSIERAAEAIMVANLLDPHKTKLEYKVKINEAKYKGRTVPLNKPMQGDVKKFKVYVKDPKTGNVKKVNFGDPNMRIKKSNPKRRKSFRARHKCDTAKDKTTARFWSCRKW